MENPTKKMIPQETWELVDKLLLERLPLAGISRVTGISEGHVQRYVNRKYAEVLKESEVREKKKPIEIAIG